MPQALIIIGTGRNALDILDVIDAINQASPTWEVAGFLDDSRAVGSQYEDRPILSGVRDAARHTNCLFVNAIGSDKSYRKRPDILAQTHLPAGRFATLVHPLAAVSRRSTLGPGVCVNGGAVVAARATIAAHAWLGAGCVVGADSVVEECAMIGARAGLSGGVRVGPAAYVGVGASVRPHVAIGARALVGLGAAVIADVLPGTTVVGNPARVLIRLPRPGKGGETPPPQAGLSDGKPSTSERPARDE